MATNRTDGQHDLLDVYATYIPYLADSSVSTDTVYLLSTHGIVRYSPLHQQLYEDGRDKTPTLPEYLRLAEGL
jgi:hypothetical protein